MGQVLTLVPGQNCAVPQETLTVEIKSGAAADFSAFRLFADGKTKQDEDFVFYGQPETSDQTISFEEKPNAGVFVLKLDQVSRDVSKIALCVTTPPEYKVISRLGTLELRVRQNGSTIITCPCEELAKRKEAALIYGEFYRRNGVWKFRYIGQGFYGGLAALATNFGVEIADDDSESSSSASSSSAASVSSSSSPEQHQGQAPQDLAQQLAATPVVRPADVKHESSSIAPTKVVLSKQTSSISLKKANSTSEYFKVNLNWHNSSAATGRSSFTPNTSAFGDDYGIDLDLAAYVKLKNGKKDLVQALGNHFGNLNEAPYIQLLGDDRTGEQEDGEWLMINPQHLDQIEEIIIFTFIYEGVPNWSKTDGVVKIQISGQPEIETHLTEGDDLMPMCAIARITHDQDNLKVERIERYFEGHASMDEFFGWGFRWIAGRK